jgi:hypothetical protein
LSALHELIFLSVEIGAASETSRLKENVIGLRQTHWLENFAITITILSYFVGLAVIFCNQT